MSFDTRLEDYLQDKLQTSADLETLDSLLNRVREQQALLRAQLQQAEQDAQQADETASQHIRQVDQHAKTFQHEQADIDRRLKVITHSETSQDAVRRFEASLSKLRRLDLANGYLGMLAEVNRLRSVRHDHRRNRSKSTDKFASQEASHKLAASPESALQTYDTLRTLQLSLKDLQTDADGAAPHLLDHIEQVTLRLRATIRDALAKDLDAILKKILWPKPAMALPESLQHDWEIAISRLLSLQKPELEASQQHNPRGDASPVLLPLEVMLAPVEARFRYHFITDRPTNRLDKPEYFLSHVLDILTTHDEFINDYMQPILLTQFRGTPMSLNPIFIDATSAFITALLPMVRAKLISTISQVAAQPQLLSHFIHELMTFDTTLRTDWHYTGNSLSPSTPWKGMTWEVLMQHDYFTRWLHVEKDFALSRYQAIIDNPTTSNLDYDSTPPGTTKPSMAAIQVNDLLEAVTDRYRPLFSFTNKLRFLIEIQISIFDRFHNRLHSGLEAYLSMTTGLGRAVQGASSADLAAVSGVNGLDRLCRIFGSADYLERKMRDWSDDVFFLDLWTDLQYRARNNKGHNSLNVAEVAARTSQTLSAGTDDEDTGALFDETAAAYARLRAKAEGVIIDTLTRHLRDSLRPYSRSNAWSALASSSSTSTTANDVTPAPSIDLGPTLSYLTESFNFLSKALGLLPLRRIEKAILRILDTYLLDRVILAHTFSFAGAAQISADVAAVAGTFEKVDPGVGWRGLGRCSEAVRLLVLEVRDGRGRARENEQDGEADAWDMDVDEPEVATVHTADDVTGTRDTEVVAQLGLWEVEHRLFASNEEARDVLEEMGLLLLTESEARQVLQRRVELGM